MLRATTSARTDAAAMARWQDEAKRTGPDDYSYYAMMARGVSMTHRDFLLANEQRQRMRRAWLGFLRIGTCSFAPSLPVQRRPMTRRASAGNAP